MPPSLPPRRCHESLTGSDPASRDVPRLNDLKREDIDVARSLALRTLPWGRALLAVGGLLWILGTVALVAGVQTDSYLFKLSFGGAGVAAAIGFTVKARWFTSMWSRVGATMCGLFVLAAGGGLCHSSWLGFIAAYASILFLLPVSMAVLAVGLRREQPRLRLVRWVPVGLVTLAVVTYGFHAFARTLWDPADWVLFFGIGVALLLLGVGLTRPEN